MVVLKLILTPTSLGSWTGRRKNVLLFVIFFSAFSFFLFILYRSDLFFAFSIYSSTFLFVFSLFYLFFYIPVCSLLFLFFPFYLFFITIRLRLLFSFGRQNSSTLTISYFFSRRFLTSFVSSCSMFPFIAIILPSSFTRCMV